MTFYDAMKIACREHIAKLPDLLAEQREQFEHISKTFAGSPEEQAASYVACTSWLLDKLLLVAKVHGDSGIHTANATCFPYKLYDREPIGDEYLFTQCIWGLVCRTAYGEVRERARVIYLSQHEQYREKHKKQEAANG